MGPAALEGAALLRHPLSSAVVEVLAERGYRDAGVGEMVARAGVETAEFDRIFAGKEDAVLRVFAACIADFKARVGAAFVAVREWPESLRAAFYQAARWMRDHEAAARFILTGVFAAGERALRMREGLVRWCAELIDVGREVAPDPEAIPAGAALMVMGATAEILNREVQSQGGAPVTLLPQMMYGAVRPYLGEEAARRELDIPLPADLRP